MTNCHLGYCTGGQSSQGSLSSDVGREGTNTKVYKFPVKAYPIFGYCGCTIKLEWYRIQTTISFIKGLRLMPQHFHHQNHQVFGKTCPKHFNRMIHHSKVFITIFTKDSHLKLIKF